MSAKSGGLVLMVAAATSYTLWTKSLLRVAKLVAVRWYNRAGGPSLLSIGYTTLGAAFVQVHPLILMLNGFDGEIVFPGIIGNTPYGFAADTTAGTGTLGNIIARASLAGAVATEVQIEGFVEEDDYDRD